ncbi:MAG: ABC transporter ATP-binding protein [Thermotogaceae bacterium]|nr:ABC transporter ATP-binding protein [Thermotogaceae bacterium]
MLIGYVLVSFSWKLSIVVFASIPFYTSTVNIFTKGLKEAAAREREKNEKILAELKEDVEGAFAVKKYDGHNYMLGKYEKKAGEWINAKKRYYFISQLVEDFFAFLRSSIPVVVLSWGGYLLIKNEITLGTLIGFYTIMNWIYEPVSEIVNLFVSAKEAVPVYERLKKVYEMQEETKGHISLPSFKSACLDDVRFTYTGKEVLKGVNLRLYRGQSVAIVGLSGSGKSTLVSLLPRYYQATAGKVLINSNNVKEYLLRELRKKIVVVHQNDFLFNTTVKENITLGEQFTEEQFQKAVRIACVDRFIGELDRGYETIVGERGSKLSDGQRQRVAIARAVIRKPEVLVLDEATSGVDSETEEKIFEGLKSLGITVVIVSHRLSTIRKAEKILVLDDGRIVEEGSHDELAEKGSMYRKIIKSQLVG